MRIIFSFVLMAVSSSALAGGYDTPMLYTAEHMGMGGAAVAGVSDASALFHNPAGLAKIKKGSGIFHMTYLRGTVTGSPGSTPESSSITSEPTSAPFPLIGGAYRLHPKVVLGMAAFPIASAGAKYNYEGFGGAKISDSTTLVFAEVGPGLGIDLGKVRFGLGYRFTYMMLERFNGAEGVDPLIDFNLTGSNAQGLRAGFQADLMDGDSGKLSLGLSYRHQVIIKPTAAEARAVGFKVTDMSSRFILPSRIVGGLRFDTGPWGVAADVEYGFNGLNQKSVLAGTAELAPGMTDDIALDNVFGWQDALTYRLGVEHRLANGIKLRLGGAYDEQTSSKQYPTAFGTPPAPTTVLGGGIGKTFGPWTVDFSMVNRRGSTEVTAEDLGLAKERCVFCSKAGTYAIDLTGTYVSVRYETN